MCSDAKGYTFNVVHWFPHCTVIPRVSLTNAQEVCGDIQPACELWTGDAYALKASSKEHHLMHHSQFFRDIWRLKLNYVTVV